MNTTAAASSGAGAAVLGLIMLFHQVGRWRGGDSKPPVHFFAGVAIAALLILGGGILGTMGGRTAVLGESIGQYALATGAAADAAGNHPAPTGGEKVGMGGVVAGLCLLLLYADLPRSRRRDVLSPLARGALCGVWLGAGVGLIGMALGLIRTSGTTLGEMWATTV